MILLSIAPCADEQESDELVQIAITKVAHGTNAGSQENCSPICLCTCCGQQIVIGFMADLEVKIPILELDQNTSNYTFSLDQRGHTIWQPPKIA